MNAPYDPLLLAALLDGELDPESRVSVEHAVRSDPAAADFLADLVRMRDAVAALPATKPCWDLSAEVVATLRARRRAGHRLLASVVTVAVSLAASFQVMVQMGWWRNPPQGPNVVAPPAPSVAAREPVLPLPLLVAAPRLGRPVAMVPPVGLAVRPETLAAEIRVRDTRAALQALVAKGEARRVDVIVDDLAPAIEAMDAVVGDSNRTRPQHAKVHLVVGSDPKRSGKACVYVLVMDGYEYDQFRQNVDKRFPNSSIKPEPAPRELVASLGSVGRIEVLAGGKPTAVLRPSPLSEKANIASRVAEPDKGHEVVVDAKGDVVQPVAKPNDRRDSIKKVAKKRDPAVDSATRVYLVWVSPRDQELR